MELIKIVLQQSNVQIVYVTEEESLYIMKMQFEQ